MKYLVLWRLEVSRLGPEMIAAVMKQSAYGQKLEADGKLECRYHIVGRHGGAWIYKAASTEDLERLLAMAPVYNFAHYVILPLAEMADPAAVLGKNG
jgi:muconolactone delta-isomerase